MTRQSADRPAGHQISKKSQDTIQMAFSYHQKDLKKPFRRNPGILTVFERERVYRDDKSEKFNRDTLRIISSMGPVKPRIVLIVIFSSSMSKSQEINCRSNHTTTALYSRSCLNKPNLQHFIISLCLVCGFNFSKQNSRCLNNNQKLKHINTN